MGCTAEGCTITPGPTAVTTPKVEKTQTPPKASVTTAAPRPVGETGENLTNNKRTLVEKAAEPESSDKTLIREIKDAKALIEFVEGSRQGKPGLIIFTKENCEPCEQLSPIFEELASKHEGKLVAAKVQDPKIALEFKVTSFPTIVVAREGRGRVVWHGFKEGLTAEALTAKLFPPPKVEKPPATEKKEESKSKGWLSGIFSWFASLFGGGGKNKKKDS